MVPGAWFARSSRNRLALLAQGADLVVADDLDVGVGNPHTAVGCEQRGETVVVVAHHRSSPVGWCAALQGTCRTPQPAGATDLHSADRVLHAPCERTRQPCLPAAGDCNAPRGVQGAFRVCADRD
jgi:hypothetical protein